MDVLDLYEYVDCTTFEEYAHLLIGLHRITFQGMDYSCSHWIGICALPCALEVFQVCCIVI
jgi:hypothetical protein